MNLKILGKVSKATIESLDYRFNNTESKATIESLDYRFNNTDLVFFVDFSNYTIPVGTIFSRIKNGDGGFAKIIRITQQYGKDFKEIPKGWKTIVELETDSEVLKKMDELDYWYSIDTPITIES